MTILFSGGGSLGPVTPLLAVARALKRLAPGLKFVWAGTPDGPERALVQAEGIAFHAIPVAKLPRYPDTRWLTFPYDMARAWGVSNKLIEEVRPDAVLSVGGFTAVPVIRSAASHGIPCLVHQLDLRGTWSNKLVAKKCVSRTSSFDQPGYERLATPTRLVVEDLPMREVAAASFGLEADEPTVLILGGGQGALAINQAFSKKKDAWLKKFQVIHSTGKGKLAGAKSAKGYYVAEQFDADEMARAYAAADLVITRAGIGTLSECASLSKPAIIVPIPGSHQVENAKAFSSAKAGLFVAQDQVEFEDILLQQATDLLEDESRRQIMGMTAHNYFPTDDGTALAERVLRSIVKT